MKNEPNESCFFDGRQHLQSRWADINVECLSISLIAVMHDAINPLYLQISSHLLQPTPTLNTAIHLIQGSAKVPTHSSTSLLNNKISLCSSPSPKYSKNAFTLPGFFLALASASLLAALSTFNVMPTA